MNSCARRSKNTTARGGKTHEDTGTGSALPAHTLTNDDLSKFLDTSDEWIRTHTGIRSRQVITDETLLQLAARAANAALENAGLAAADIDYILASSVLPDTITPSLGCLLQAQIGANCPALDVNGACAGFLYALDLADALTSSGKANRVLVVCAEGMTRMVDWTDRSTCVLFGDGAGAAVVDGGEGGLMATLLTSQGDVTHLNMYPDPATAPSPPAASRARPAHGRPGDLQIRRFPTRSATCGPSVKKRAWRWMRSTTSFSIRPTSASSTPRACASSSRSRNSP